MLKQLSSEQKRCIDIIKQHGSVRRWPGGFWQHPGCPGKNESNNGDSYFVPLEYICTNTIKSLLNKGLLIILETKLINNVPFPVRVGLK